jgi:hypothetical protein
MKPQNLGGGIPAHATDSGPEVGRDGLGIGNEKKDEDAHKGTHEQPAEKPAP